MKYLSLFCMALLSAVAYGQNPQKELHFNGQGEFKIVQLTDIHYVPQKAEASAKALECIEQVLDAEKPDLVVFTGDLIFGSPAEPAMRTVLQRVSDRKIPFAVTLGNHDDEQGMTRGQLYSIIASTPYSLQSREESEFALSVRSSDGQREAAILYCIDSNAYSPLPDTKTYAWITLDQINWYRNESRSHTAANNGKPLPALAFFHIPLPEYHQAVQNENAIMRGTRMEEVCSPVLNSGLFTAMKEQGDVMGCFVGHDHDNDYAVMWYDILLAYGRYTGGNTVYNHLPNGARVIVLKEGERSFDTWIRLRTGEVEQRTSYPDSYVKK